MSAGFGAEKSHDGKARVVIDDDQMAKLLKEYKRLKKYQKSSMYEVAKMTGKETELDRLLKEYGDGTIKYRV